MTNSTKKYHISMRITHWLMAALILGVIGLGWYMNELPKGDALKGTLVGLHKSFGVLALILFFVRTLLRFTTKTPPLPKTIPLIERKLALLGHQILYIFIAIVPLSGYAMSNLSGYSVKMFNFALPNIFPKNKEFAHFAHEAHEILPYILLIIIALHVVAVLRHRFFDKPENDVLGRML